MGRQVLVDGQPMEIVGGNAVELLVSDPDSRLLVLMSLDARGFGTFGTRTIARLVPNMPIETARAGIDHHPAANSRAFPGLDPGTLSLFPWSVTLESLREHVVRDVATPLWILLGSVGFLLLMAGANVANLFLVRAESRRREVAVRASCSAQAAAALPSRSSQRVCCWPRRVACWVCSWLHPVSARGFGPPQCWFNEITVDLTTIAFASILASPRVS